MNSKNITQLFHNNKTPITLQQSKPHAQIQRVIPPATQPITTQQSTAEKQSHQPSSVLLKPSGKVTVFEAAQNKSKQQEERGETTQTLHTFAQNVIKTTTQQEIAVKTNSSLPFPSTPKQPNVVVGMVLDQNRKIVDGAIVEIVDQTGIAVRAVKTNKLGQFFITSPLQNGAFSIRTEKNGLEFNNYTLTTNNTIIPPLEFLAKTS
ncbi:MAG: hypothetical protein A2378_01390 [Candidatus Pacebacteria bacterium RIFOXYB1_FULL_44_10]|nr:MAG: hypothetical protein A2378_01390 [Candidatus Pacebacteria bacterium RIFOXYB1_FULL_44_10]